MELIVVCMLAYIGYILEKKFPSGIKFDQPDLRRHILRCLCANKLRPFPLRNEELCND